MNTSAIFSRSFGRRSFLKGAAALAATAAVGRTVTVSAAAGDPVLIAGGQSTIPADPFAWRVIRDTAVPRGDVEFKERALGFVFAPEGLVLEDDGGDPHGVDPGGAAFIPEGVVQAHASHGGFDMDYLRIGIVPAADAGFTAGGELLFGSEGFAAPVGVRRIELYSVELDENTGFDFPASDAPILFHILEGAGIIFENSDGEDGDYYHLMAGDSYLAAVQDGTPWKFGNGSPTRAIFAVIGDQVTEENPPVDQDEPIGAIVFQIFACDMPGGDIAECRPDETLPLPDFAALKGNGFDLTQEDWASREGDIGWLNLPFGDYEVGLSNDYGVFPGIGDEGAFGQSYGNTAVWYPITLSAENPTVQLRLATLVP